MVKLSHGVRQGGVLSPILFALYVDKMLCKLNESELGCRFNGLPIAALMYADDILIVTSSVTHMQKLINMCNKELLEIDLQVNIMKSSWIRIGFKYKSECVSLSINNELLKNSDEFIFLGSVVSAGLKFSISLSRNKTKFFCNANKILSKIGNSNLPVIMQLINSYCLSGLLYNLEVFDLTKSQVNSLLFVVNRLYIKICKTAVMANVQYCLYNFGQLPLDILLLIRKCKYLNTLVVKGDIISDVFSSVIDTEINDVIVDWKKLGQNLNYPCKPEGWNIFANRLQD